jgi:curli production assembly/transport component CsgF
MKAIKHLSTWLGACALAATFNATATELVYVPLNPSFGGSPLNGNAFLSRAQATNRHKEPDPFANSLDQTPLQQFNQSLERAVLGQLASSATSRVLGPDGRLVPGSLETGNFRIVVSDIGGGLLQVTTTDKTTGATSLFQVGGQ